jgi:hypothetical protein
MFDLNYLDRGLVLYQSMVERIGEFHLFVVAFDDETFAILEKLSLPNLTPVRLIDFEDAQLVKVKGTRTWTEYVWTCTPSVIRYVLQTHNLPDVTYLDADLFFFGSPEMLFRELEGGSILLTKHNYSARYDQAEKSGIYCVQYMTFRNDDNGRSALEWWRDSCIEWCYNRFVDGRFGDQKYLDDWTTRFEGVRVSQNLGAGIAPWNVQGCSFAIQDDELRFHSSQTEGTVIFYHFHQLRLYENGYVDLGIYSLTKDQIKKIYAPYVKGLDQARRALGARIGREPRIKYQVYRRSWRTPVKWLHRVYLGGYNINRTQHLIASSTWQK